MTDTARTTPVWISEPPIARTVEQQTGTVAPELLTDALRIERDEIAKQRDDARDELANMINLGKEVGRLSNFLEHAIADRDHFREVADEWRDKYDAAQCRMDEMAAEIRELRGAQ